MIIVELEIENYKQFAGSHRITFPVEGAVAVIGHNGAGKTTLFEAIEWALYGPRSIAAGDIRPRQGTGGAPSVRVTLQTPEGRRYQVERRFKGKSKSAEAAIYELDEHGDIMSTVVTGPKDVTARVSGSLIGLSHPAFVSTFFTRQKELSFFAELGTAERRRQISRLLGLETIRDAQQLIGTDRADRETTARGLRAQYQRESEGRDFGADRVAQTARLDDARGQVEEAEQTVAARTADRAMTEESERYWLELQARDDALLRRIGAVDGQIATTADRIAGIDRQLERLAGREAELARLAPIAAREPELLAETERWQRERERATRRQTLTTRLDEITHRRATRLTTLRTLPTGGEVVPGWLWRATDDAQPAIAAERLQAVARAVDLRAARAEADATARAAQAGTDHTAAGSHLSTCESWLLKLRGELDALFADGDPAGLVRAAQQRQSAATAVWVSASGEEKALQVEVDKLRQSTSRLREEGSSSCPTCGQPIDAIVLRTLQDGIADRERKVAQLRALATTNRELDRMAGIDLAAAQARQDAVNTLRERIRNGETRTEEARSAHSDAGERLRVALAAAGLTEVPSDATVQSATRRVEERAAVVSQADRLGDLALQFRDDDARAAETREELDALGVVAYDETAHKAARAALGAAQAAGGQAGEIRNELGQRPQLATDREAATAELAARRAERSGLERERQAVGFDADSLTSARAQAKEAVDLLLAATGHLNAVRTAERDARLALEAIDREEARVADLATQAAAADQSADELQRMYKGFDDFERWVAQRMNPLLADRASEILAEVTNGEYDRVRFDDDYGLHIYDGDEDFPVAQFSGGERDVASLAARLALSRLIGAQAAHPPAFVVLDEVFGSLDQERRTRLLGMLDVLTNDDAEGFRQLFVISHVDDVRQSQAFDEVWRITADGQGVSQWENLQVSGGIEEL